ncbi:MAG: DUF3568 family protein [Candidatus Omnitrophica bacterium]|nr:DUF3568 family protein [Candidatus Omnitrophota bacterium]
MARKIGLLVFAVIVAVSLYGCVALLAGAAGGAGTAAWLSGKLSQEVNAPFDRSIAAAESALKSLNLVETKITKKEDVAQVMSNYTDGRTVWIDIHRVTQSSSKIEVRVGAAGDKEAAQKILNSIVKHL